MKMTTIERHCRNCDHSKVDVHNTLNGLSCSKGRKTHTYSQELHGQPCGYHLDNAARVCPFYNPGQIVQIEIRRGFVVEVQQ